MVERLAFDDRLPRRPVVVVSADSVQAYRGLDIGSAKPSLEERERLDHELIDILDPTEPYSVGEFLRLADEACERAVAAGRLPILSGGTAYYVKAFLYGAPTAPKSDPAVRAAVEADLARLGVDALRAELQGVDPEAAGRIARADVYRLTRALEVYRSSGRPLSSFAPPERRRPRWDCLVIGLQRPRDELYARVDARVDAMLAAGLKEEVGSLVAKGLGPGDPGMRAIGYAEFLSGLPERDVAALIKRNTRRYAKRQLTFMRALPEVTWLDANDYDALIATVAAWLGEPVSASPPLP